jgi:competence ComEA-like helix-hairpin-helix protein
MFPMTEPERRAVLFVTAAALVGMGGTFLKNDCRTSKIALALFEDIGKVNLNTADKELLMSVSGIGSRLAERILEYRRQAGGFRQVEELKRIQGINEYRFGKIRDHVVAK